MAVSPAGGKGSRAAAAQARVEAGQVFLPRPRTAAGVDRPEYAFVENLMEELARFPRGRYDDDVDAFTQLIVWCWQHPHVEPCSSSKIPDTRQTATSSDTSVPPDERIPTRARWPRLSIGRSRHSSRYLS